MLLLYVGIAGLLGVICRYILNFWKQDIYGITLSTISVNIIGSILIGFMSTLHTRKIISEQIYIIVSAGFIGALTTFSGYTLNLAIMINSFNTRMIISAIIYGILAPFIGLSFVWLGMLIGLQI